MLELRLGLHRSIVPRSRTKFLFLHDDLGNNSDRYISKCIRLRGPGSAITEFVGGQETL